MTAHDRFSIPSSISSLLVITNVNVRSNPWLDYTVASLVEVSPFKGKQNQVRSSKKFVRLDPRTRSRQVSSSSFSVCDWYICKNPRNLKYRQRTPQSASPCSNTQDIIGKNVTYVKFPFSVRSSCTSSSFASGGNAEPFVSFAHWSKLDGVRCAPAGGTRSAFDAHGSAAFFCEAGNGVQYFAKMCPKQRRNCTRLSA